MSGGVDGVDAHTTANYSAHSEAVLPEGVEEVGINVDADFLLTPPPSPKDTTAETGVVPQNAFIAPTQPLGIAAWRRSTPVWNNW